MKNKTDLFDKITKGVQSAYIKLVKEKAKEDGELIFSENGKIIRVKATQLLHQMNK